jgi:ribosomal protein L25 (general stress protein Ctc)
MDSVEQTIRMNNLSKELRKYGFAQSSQEAIAQAGQIYGADTESVNAELELVQLTKAQYDEMMNTMQRLWVFKENSAQKTSVIAEQLVKVTDKLNELIKTISLIEMNQAVFDKKLNSLKDNIHESFREESRPAPRRESPSRESRHVEESSAEKEVQSRLDKPIDRNGVAPADVAIENIFYCGDKTKLRPQIRSQSMAESAPEKKVDQPIDRNGVATADVSIQKIFYCGNK